MRQLFKRTGIALCVLFFTGQLNAQDLNQFENLMCSSQEHYNLLDAYEVTLKYSIYTANDRTVARESYAGLIAKTTDGRQYQKIGNLEWVRFEESAIQINHEEKALWYSSNHTNTTQTLLEMSDYAKFFKEIRVTPVKDGWKCELSNPKPILNIGYEKVEIYLNASYQITRQILYPYDAVTFYNNANAEEVSRPVLVIDLETPTKLEDQSYFHKKNYIRETTTGVQPAHVLKNYQLIKA